MKTIQQLAIPKEVSADFPFGAIVNETETTEGTPVVREIYNDILVNCYKLLELSGITPNGGEDNESNGYQIVEALRKIPNLLNDTEQILSLDISDWSVPFALELLPNKYFFVARASEDYVAGSTYTFSGTGTASYGFTSLGFKSGDELMVIIDTGGVRAYSLSAFGESATEVFTVLGTPVAFNDTNKMWYQEAGILMSDVPSVDHLEYTIRVELSNGTILLNDILILNGYVLCFCLIPSTNTYFFRQFPLTDFSVSTAVVISGASFSNVSDFMPYVYAQSGIIYVTNGMNSTANDYTVAKLNYNGVGSTLTFVSTTNIDNAFAKTTNAVIKSGLLYTMISGVFNSFNLTSGAKISLGNYSGVVGQIFGFNGQVYFSSGEVAKKWF
jgi:hypothetical protein